MLILVAAATLPALAALTYLHHDLMAERRDHLAEETREHAELVAENIGGVVEELRRAMAAVTEMRPDLDMTCPDRLRIALSQSAAIERIAVLGADGKPVCAAGWGLGPEQIMQFLARPAVRAAVNEALQSGEFVVGRRVAPEGGERGMLPLALPNGRPPAEGTGVIVATLGLD
jgi:hypothetical protein